MHNLESFIDRYRTEGLSFIPIPYKSKVPAIEWKQFQQSRPNEDQVRNWFNSHDTNIAVICGSVSGGLVVLDFDSEDGFWEFDAISSEKTGMELLDFTRVSKTARGFHVWLRVQETVKNRKYPRLDIKSDGGYILVPPSVHPDGSVYELLNPDIPIRKIDSLKAVGIDPSLTEQTSKVASGKDPCWVTQALLGAEDGSRGDTAIKLAGYFRNTLPIGVTTTILLDWNRKNRPPMEEYRIHQAIKSAYRYPEHKRFTQKESSKENTLLNNCPESQLADTGCDESVTENVTRESGNSGTNPVSLAKRVEDFFRDSSGWVSVDQIDREFEIRTASEKANAAR